LLLCLLGLLGLAAPAAAQTITDERVWFNLTLQSRADARTTPWRWSVEIVARSRDGIQTLDVAALRPTVNYALDRHSSVGGGYVLVEYSPTGASVTDHRVFQHYAWSGSAGGGTLGLRARVEERFIEGNSGMAARLRLQVRYSHPLRKGSPVAVVGYDEFFVHLNTTTATLRGMDQNRAFAGISDTLNPSVRIEVGYLNQHGLGHDTRDVMNHVLSGTLAFGF
jgi:hypothetical protein